MFPMLASLYSYCCRTCLFKWGTYGNYGWILKLSDSRMNVSEGRPSIMWKTETSRLLSEVAALSL